MEKNKHSIVYEGVYAISQVVILFTLIAAVFYVRAIFFYFKKYE